jgi:hypothetical protein
MSREQYEAALEYMNFEGDPPPGMLLHVSSMGPDGFRVTDVWDTPESFQAFAETRMMDAAQRAGAQNQPNIIFGEVIRMSAPGNIGV